MTKRVLHVFGIMNRGGAELRTLSTMEYMLNKGISYDFVVLTGKKGVLDDQIKESGGTIHYCPLGKGFIFRFAKLLRKGNYDILHSHVSLASGLMIFMAWLFNIKVRIAHFRSTNDVANPSAIRKIRDFFLRKLLLLFSTNIVGVCVAALNAFWSKDWSKNNKFHVIYNGFPTVDNDVNTDFWAHYIPEYQGQDVIINVARMDEPKNHPRIVEIFAEFAQLNTQAILVFVGKEEPSIKATMLEITKKHHISHRLHFLNEQSNVIPFLTNANLMLFPSKWEGLPGAVIESISAGTPVLGSKIPGIVEISEHLNTVTPVSLSQSNQEWAQNIVSKLDGTPPKTSVKAQFNQSTFIAKHNLEQTYALYTVHK